MHECSAEDQHIECRFPSFNPSSVVLAFASSSAGVRTIWSFDAGVVHASARWAVRSVLKPEFSDVKKSTGESGREKGESGHRRGVAKEG